MVKTIYQEGNIYVYLLWKLTSCKMLGRNHTIRPKNESLLFVIHVLSFLNPHFTSKSFTGCTSAFSQLLLYIFDCHAILTT
jgi:hypothetical protein